MQLVEKAFVLCRFPPVVDSRKGHELCLVCVEEVRTLFLSPVLQLEMKPQGRLLMEAKYYLERSGESLWGASGRLAGTHMTLAITR